MHRIDGAGNVAGEFVHEDAATNRPPTEVTADWLNAVQEELAAVIVSAGLTLDKANNGQLLAALLARFALLTSLTGYVTAQQLADAINSIGAVDLSGLASLAGNAGQVFSVANAVADGHAVPKVQMEAFINAAVGSAQTWLDMIASRAAGTIYQNTTGHRIEVNISAANCDNVTPFEVSADGVAWVGVGTYAQYSTGYSTMSTCSFSVPSGHYYRLNSVTASIGVWSELR